MSQSTLTPQAEQAIEELVRRVRDGFTGSLVLEFKDGVPQLARTTSVRRFKSEKRSSLDRRVVKQ